MSSPRPEIPLSGGTLSVVVRVGDTVRRTAGPWTPTVQELLRHVRSRGFDVAPEPLGLDESGREVLRYVPGETVGWSLPWPAWIRSDEMLDQVGLAVAAYHRAVSDFRPAGPVIWNAGPAEMQPSQIVCHHDLAPYNIVASPAGRLRAFIDWDLAGPGTALSDLAFVAWQWVPLYGPFVASMLGWAGLAAEPGVAGRARRLRRLLDAYGLDDRSGFVAAVADRVRYNRAIMLDRAAAGDVRYRSLVEQGHVAGMDEALTFLNEAGEALQAQL